MSGFPCKLGVHPRLGLLEGANAAPLRLHLGKSAREKGLVLMRILAVLLGLLAFALAAPLAAQDRTWLQIEAQPNLNTALDRARAYSALFPDVEGYRLSSGWYGIALGPQSRDEAGARLLDLRRQNMIPADSYLSDGSGHGQRFWPVGADDAAPEVPDPDATAALPDPAAEPVAEAPPEVDPDETPAQARVSEAELTAEDRMALQEALKWYGFYDGGVDGSFGKGTRASMAAWQGANGLEQTGILTIKQRAQLTGSYRADRAEFGFETVSEAESGIEITLPLALIQFDRYEPPFVHYSEKAGSGLKVLLISEPGGKAGLAGLYDVLQTLELVPPTGERALEEASFTLRGSNDKIETLAFAQVESGNIKGYLISWNRADGARMNRILPALRSSFRSLGDQVLDPGLVPLSEAAKRGILSGLEVRHPRLSRTGFFIDTNGSVLTTSQAVSDCGKIMLERSVAATVRFQDTALGYAVLTPASPLSPGSVAEFSLALPRPGAPVSVSGYSYEDKLSAPVVTRGVIEELRGLNGEAGLTRMTLSALPGDTGGPVLDAYGAVLGMLLPADPKATKQLPDGVAFAASAAALSASLTAKGIIPTAASSRVEPTPNALAAKARGMTVLVSCWD